MALKYGKLPPKLHPQTLTLSKYMASVLPPPEEKRGWEYAVPDDVWAHSMLGNDTVGNCLVEGTSVQAGDIGSAYKAHYNGCVIRLTMADGKRLTVTPNHAVLTPRGFALAKFIKQGDDLVGTCGTQPLPSVSPARGELDLNQPPVLVQDVFTAFNTRNNLIRKVMPVPVDFHGDAKFFDGDVDVVTTERFLCRELDSTLRQPYPKNQIGPASYLKRSLKSLRATFQGCLWPPMSTYGYVGFGGHRAAFGYAHAGVAQSKGLHMWPQLVSSGHDGPSEPSAINVEPRTNVLHRLARYITPNRFGQVPGTACVEEHIRFGDATELYASLKQPVSDEERTDSKLAANLLKGHSGLVELNRVIQVETTNFVGHVFDFSTDKHWYSANGIITHNCVEAATLHYIMVATAEHGAPVTFTAQDGIDLYSWVTGYNPADPSTDQGTAWTDMLAHWKNKGCFGHRILGWAAVDYTDATTLNQAIDIFGAVLIGTNVTSSMETQFSAGQPWNAPFSNDSVGGHGIPLTGFGRDGRTCLTWAAREQMDLTIPTAEFDEAYVVIDREFLDKARRTPLGIDLHSLQADLEAIAA